MKTFPMREIYLDIASDCRVVFVVVDEKLTVVETANVF